MIGNLVTPIFYGKPKAPPPTRLSTTAYFVPIVCHRDGHHGFL